MTPSTAGRSPTRTISCTIHDMTTFTTYVEDGKRKFAGLFGPGKGSQQFVAGEDFDSLASHWVMSNRKNCLRSVASL